MKRLLLPLLMLLSALSLNAADANRAEKWEFYFAPQYVDGRTISHNGASAKLNSMSSLLFGFGYNYDNHLNLGLYFNAANGNYQGTYIDSSGNPQTFSGSTYVSTVDMTVSYNFLESSFTPYVLGNFGITYIDTGIPSGLPSSGCYWIGFYQYCGVYQPTYTTTQFNFGGQVGVRYDFPNALFLKAGVGLNWVNTSGTPDFTLYNFAVGFKFQ